ncbi:hypothetical protein TUM20983_36930 [Mycobacterium antarcticum]|nr:hypothetical protein TUM20983_36930 [Mycolicibacterium sp. TUM20983]
MFTAVNNSPVVDDTLLAATSDVGTVTLTGNTTVPAGGLLNVEVPHELTPALQAARTEQGINATVSLTNPITNGLTCDSRSPSKTTDAQRFRCRSPLERHRCWIDPILEAAPDTVDSRLLFCGLGGARPLPTTS